MKNFILMLLMIATPLMADDGYLGAWNGSAYAFTPTKVQMSSELVYITLYDTICTVRCKFIFTNHGETQKVKVGFPDYIKNKEESLGSQPLRNFRSAVDGKPVEVKRELIYQYYKNNDTKGNSGYSDSTGFYWLTKEVVFPANMKVIIEDYYEASWSEMANLFGSKFFNYFVGTGSTWYNDIEDGKIIYDLSHYSSSAFINKKNINAQLKNSSVSFENEFAIIQFNNFKPDSNDVVGFNFFDYQVAELSDYLDVKEARKMVAREFAQSFYLDDIKKMIMEVEARKGKVFDEPKVQQFYAGKSWYKPDSSYNLKKLTGKSKEIFDFFDYAIKQNLENLDQVSEETKEYYHGYLNEFKIK